MEVVLGSLRLAVGVVFLAAAARRLSRHFFAGSGVATAESFLGTVLGATLLVVTTTALAGTAGLLGPTALLVFAAAAYGLSRLVPSTAGPVPAWTSRRYRLVFWPLWPVAVVVLIEAAVFLPVSPVQWDAMTYHLYFPARWLHEGRLFHIPTVFSDNSAAFAPQNGALFFAWQMALLGRDATTDISQVLCLAILAAAVYRGALVLGLGRQPAAMAAALAFFLNPLRYWTLTANVDVFMTAFWIAGGYWLLAYVTRGGRERLVACGLALGLAAGTKTVAVPLVAVPTAIVVMVLVLRRCFREVAILVAAMTAAGGFWYLKNLVLYGNPVFPLDLRLPGIHFRGAYTSTTLRGSQFHLDEPAAWIESIVIQWGVLTWVLVLVGLAGLLIWTATARGSRRAVPLGLALFTIFWVIYDYLAVPHNNQARFLLPILGLTLLGWAYVFDRVRHRRLRAGLFVLAAVVALVAARPDFAWAYHLATLAAAGIETASWLAAALLSGAVALAALLLRRRLLVAGATLLVLPVLALASSYCDRGRIAFLADADFRAWSAGYLMFNDPALAPRRIAYAGINFPYALMGPGFRHEVVYCNTSGLPDDGFYDFWARDPRLYPSHKPGIYRGNDDFDAWWQCLEERRVDTVVLFSTIAVERPAHWRLSGDFPIERDWMRSRRETFEPVLLTARSEIYQVRKAESR